MTSTATPGRTPAERWILRLSSDHATIGSELKFGPPIRLAHALASHEWTSKAETASDWRTGQVARISESSAAPRSTKTENKGTDRSDSQLPIEVEYKLDADLICCLPWAVSERKTRLTLDDLASRPDEGSSPATKVKGYHDLIFYPSGESVNFHAHTMKASGVPTETEQSAGQLVVHPRALAGQTKPEKINPAETCFRTTLQDKLLFDVPGHYGVEDSETRIPGTLRVNASLETRPVQTAGSSVGDDGGGTGDQLTVPEQDAGGGTHTLAIRNAPSDHWVSSLGVD